MTLKDGKWDVDNSETLPEGRMAQISIHELICSQEIVRADERVRKLAADVGESNNRPLPKDYINLSF